MTEGSNRLQQALVLMEVALHFLDEAGLVAAATCNLDLAINQLREALTSGNGLSEQVS